MSDSKDVGLTLESIRGVFGKILKGRFNVEALTFDRVQPKTSPLLSFSGM